MKQNTQTKNIKSKGYITMRSIFYQGLSIFLVCIFSLAYSRCSLPEQLDRDGDNILDVNDNCPDTANTEQNDADEDSMGDACDDSDEDGFFDDIDTCRLLPNNPQTDMDRDGMGDACDVDDDGNGLIDIRNSAMLYNIRYNLKGTSYYDPDTATEGTGDSSGCGGLVGINKCNGYELLPEGESTIIALDANSTWTPISGDFLAIFDGNNNTIQNLRITAASDSGDLGFFESIGSGGIVRNLTIQEMTLMSTSSESNVGSLAGSLLSEGRIERVRIVNQDQTTGGLDVNASLSLGGLVGSSEGTIYDSSTSMRVANTNTSKLVFVGGLAGDNAGYIIDSYATGVTGRGNNKGATGGLVGQNAETIMNSYATGPINDGFNYEGGLAGVSTGTIINSYATGSINGADSTGGLVGLNSGDIENTYAADGTVSGTQSVGGFVGFNNGTIKNSYATGAVSRTSGTQTSIGGFIGTNNAGTTVENSYYETTSLVLGSSSGDTIGTNVVTGIVVNRIDLKTTTPTAWSNNDWDFGDIEGSDAEFPALQSFIETNGVQEKGLILCGQPEPRADSIKECP